jgi:hypothetical protein
MATTATTSMGYMIGPPFLKYSTATLASSIDGGELLSREGGAGNGQVPITVDGIRAGLEIPGADRPLHLRALIVLGGAAMLAPVGMLLQAAVPDRPLRRVAMLGLLLAAGMTLGSMTILGAAPSLFSVPLRWLGVIGGAVAYRWLRRHAIAPLRPILPWLAAAAVLPYLLALLVANSLLPLRWRSMAEIWAVLDPRFFLPFWTHYMVPKAQAIKSVAVHALMYMPVGMMVWAWLL